MKNTTKIHQMKITSHLRDLKDDFDITPKTIKSNFNLIAKKTGDDELPTQLVGEKSDILKFLQHLNSETMGGGEDESDWEQFITPFN